MQQVKIVEVGARDGLQNEKIRLSVQDRVEFIERLARAGLKSIEAGAFVSAKWVPQMENSDKVAIALSELQKTKTLDKRIDLSYLVPNARGFEDAMNSNVNSIALFGAVSETFSKKNVNCSIDESFQKFSDVMILAKKKKIKVRGYLSTCFYCPFEGKQKPARVAQLAERFLKLGVYEISIGDTIGAATPGEVRTIVKLLKKSIGLKKMALHFHDTRGTALANILAGLDLGVGTFDASLGGLGGCPYAPGAKGNVATEDVIYMLHGMGVKTGVDLEKLIEVGRWFESRWKLPLHSRVTRAGLPKT